MGKTLEALQEDAKKLKIAISADGKALTAPELTTAIKAHKAIEAAKKLNLPLEVEGKPQTTEELLTAIDAHKAIEAPKKLNLPLEVEGKPQTTEELKVAIKAHKAANKKTAKEGEKTIKVLKSLAGRFLLSATVGETVSYPKKQADEIIEQGYGEEV